MPLSPELLEAYAKTDYAVFGRPELVLHIGEHSADLDELLEAEGADAAAFLTAANPGGRAASAWKNELANAALVEALNKAGVRCFEGEGRARDRKWIEKSVLAVGISREDAEKAGRAFGQNAIVFVELGRAPELVVLD